MFLGGGSFFAVGNSGTILRTTNVGNNWVLQNSNTTNNLNSIYFAESYSGHEGYAAGAYGTVVKTTNGGDNWQVLNTGITENLNNVKAFGVGQVMVFGNNLSAYSSLNGGSTWSQMTFPTERIEGRSPKLEEAFFLDTVFSNALTGYIVGDSWVWKTTNGGNNWESGGSFGTTQLHTIYFSSPDSGFVAGEDGEVYYTTNGGEDWDFDTAASNITTKTIRSFSVLDTNLGVVAGDSGLLVYVSTDSITLGIGNNNAGSAMSFLLSQNYPNPFNPNTNISFKISSKSIVKSAVYDINGRKISTLVNEIKVRGEYIVGFSAYNLPSGVCFYRITVEGINSSDKFTETKKMLLIK